MDMFQIANTTNLVGGDFGSLESALYEVGENLTIMLPFEVQPKSVYINGLEETTGEAEAGKFVVKGTTGDSPATEIETFAGDVAMGDSVRAQRRWWG